MKIYIFIDIEEGHVLPTISMAKSLIEQGYEVTYLGIADHLPSIKKYDLNYKEIFCNTYPEGFIRQYKAGLLSDPFAKPIIKYHLGEIIDGELDDIFLNDPPALLIISSFLSVEAMILHSKYKLKILLHTPYLPDFENDAGCLEVIMSLPGHLSLKIIRFLSAGNEKITNMGSVFSNIQSFPELIACPAELLIGPAIVRKCALYVEPSIRPDDRMSIDNVYNNIDSNRQVIYASLGSQATLFDQKARHFKNLLIEVMRNEALQAYHLILVTSEISVHNYTNVPPNVTLLSWAPQLDILSKARLAIIHGGLGTIKECIFFGVPMMVYPLMRDGPANAQRIQFHQLGDIFDFSKADHNSVIDKILSLLANEAIRENIDNMRKVFRKYEEDKPGLIAIESILTNTI